MHESICSRGEARMLGGEASPLTSTVDEILSRHRWDQGPVQPTWLLYVQELGRAPCACCQPEGLLLAA